VDVAAWLQGLGLERYEPASRDNGIDAEVLPRLTVEDLKDIGVTRVGDRRKLLDAIATLRLSDLALAGSHGVPDRAPGRLARKHKRRPAFRRPPWMGSAFFARDNKSYT
jgi:hypothetical protein